MKKWIENSDNLSEYYGWYPIEKIENINLISYNFTDANLEIGRASCRERV